MKTFKSFIVFPGHCNNLGELIFGGHFAAQLDLAAADCSRRFLFDSKSAWGAVTHKINIVYHKPCYIGDLVDIFSEVIAAGQKSLTINVKAFRNVQGVLENVADAEFIFIAIREPENLREHPVLLPYVYHGLEVRE